MFRGQFKIKRDLKTLRSQKKIPSETLLTGTTSTLLDPSVKIKRHSEV